jgi:predicted GIY-YIG superfamily endonuclease
MHIVYILTSIAYPERCYIGYTTNLKNRLEEHNSEQSVYSKKYAPWHLETYVTFDDELTARRFERYLKEGSGQAFLKKHLLPKYTAK